MLTEKEMELETLEKFKESLDYLNSKDDVDYELLVFSKVEKDAPMYFQNFATETIF